MSVQNGKVLVLEEPELNVLVPGTGTIYTRNQNGSGTQVYSESSLVLEELR